MAVSGIIHYVLTALKLRTNNDNHAKHMDRPILWVPHMLTMWMVFLTLTMVTGFVFANGPQPNYDNYHNQCLLRSTHVQVSFGQNNDDSIEN